MILALRTDSSECYIGLYDGEQKIVAETWQADRHLARELLAHIANLLTQAHRSWNDISGVIVYTGPGSFTGLRIGLTVANTIASRPRCAIVGTDGEAWLRKGAERLAIGDNDRMVLPYYGAEPRITDAVK